MIRQQHESGGKQPETRGRYKILKELGRGAMGQVFLAHDPQIDRKVAIKTVQIFSALPEHERREARERFLREARAAGKLMHPSIVTMFDVGESDGELFLAMEYVEGVTVDAFTQAGNLLPHTAAVELVAEAAEALAVAHQAGIIHRDIKPANLMRVGESSVKIMDFGLAKPPETQLTHDGALFGTPSYMSPEQIRAGAVDGRSDLFSLAVVLFELLSGRRPFPGDSISSIVYRIVNEPARSLAELKPDTDPSVDRFLQRALEKDPERRFADGQQFAQALRQAAGAAPPVKRVASKGSVAPAADADTSGPPSLAKPPRRSSPMPFVLALILLIGAAAAAAYTFRDELGLTDLMTPAPVWWEATVRTEPPGLDVSLDGVPLDPAQAGLLRFSADGPFGVLSARFECRTLEHQLGAGDAGGEVAFVFDPVEVTWQVDPGVDSASISLNGDSVGTAAAALELDLCRPNVLAAEAAGFRPAQVEIPPGVTPLEARTLIDSLRLEELPKGLLILPETRYKVVYYVDGRRVGEDERELELHEGTHEVRMKNDGYWVDVRRTVQVVGEQRVDADLTPPALTKLVVQAYPANCKVFLRRPGGKWKYVDDTPVSRNVAVGRYDVRVKLNPTGATRDRQIELNPGDNPPLRVSFGRKS